MQHRVFVNPWPLALALLFALGAGREARAEEMSDDDWKALQAEIGDWNEMEPAERLDLCRRAAGSGREEAVDLLSDAALRAANSTAVLRAEITDVKQRFFQANYKGRKAEADALRAKDKALGRQYEEIKTLNRGIAGLWSRVYAVKNGPEGTKALIARTARLGNRILEVERDRWSAQLGTRKRLVAGERYNALVRARDGLVDALSRRASDVGVLVRDGLRKHKGKGALWTRAVLVEALGRIKTKESTAALLDVIKNRKEAFPVKVLALTGLADHDAKGHAKNIAKALGDKNWPVALQAADTLTALDAREQAGDIIKAMGKAPAGSRLRDGLDQALMRLTGRNFYGEPKLWRKWWSKSKAAFIKDGNPRRGEGGFRIGREKQVKKGVKGAAGRPDRSTGVTFYGIRIVSKRVVFILDRSGSMLDPVSPAEKKFVITSGPGAEDFKDFDGTKLALAKIQLKRAVRALPRDAEFNVYFYNHEFLVWKPALQPATETKKRELLEYIDEQTPIGTTNIFDPLEHAFRIGDGGYKYGPDTVVLLTDGQPNEGRIINQHEIREEIKRMNRSRRIVIHTVGVGEHDRAFLMFLAEENGGQYKGY